MEPSLFSEIVVALASRDIEICVGAAERLHKECTAKDAPALLELLKSDDFFVREAAAWPLVEVAGPVVLQDLLIAYQRGFDEGHDNDGFTAALLELTSLEPIATREAAARLAETSAEPMKSHAEWLLSFCTESPEANC